MTTKIAPTASGIVTIEVTIEGTSPLIHCAIPSANQEQMSKGTRKVKAPDQRPPREQAADRLYTDLDGHPVIPKDNLLACIVAGGSFEKAGRKQLTTAKSSILAGCFDILEETIPIEHDMPWEVKTTFPPNQATGGRNACHRPMFPHWKITFHIRLFDVERIPLDLMRRVIDNSGTLIGLMAMRPQCKRTYGRFVVIHWEEVT